MNVFFQCVNILLFMTFDFSQCIHSLFVIYQENIIQFAFNLLNPKTVPTVSPSELLDSSEILLDSFKLLDNNTKLLESPNLSIHTNHDYNIPTPPLTLSPSLSTSSLSSLGSNWSHNNNKVEDMIRLFESDLPKRRCSVDSYSPRKTFIRQRRFDYTPIYGEWKRRELETIAQPCLSKSTPTRTTKRNQSLF